MQLLELGSTRYTDEPPVLELDITEDVEVETPPDPRAEFCRRVLDMSLGDTVQGILEEVDPAAAAERLAGIERAARNLAEKDVIAMVPGLMAKHVEAAL